MSTFRAYLDQAGELPREVLLGHVVMYTITDRPYDLDRLTELFDQLDIDKRFLPAGCKPVDAYKKATNDADDFEYTLRNGNVAHVLVRDVASDNEVIVRHLVREVRDSGRRRLAHDTVGEAVFYRPKFENGLAVQDSYRFRLNIMIDPRNPERGPLQSVVDKIDASFTRHLAYLDGMKIRAMVREYIRAIDGIELKPSVYFIPVGQYDELRKLTELIRLVGNDCVMQLMPLVDLAEQRDMVINAWQSEAEDALKSLVEKIAKLRESRKKITPEAFAKIRAEYDVIMERGTEYRKHLNLAVDVTEGVAEVAFSQLTSLAESMAGIAA